MTLYDRKKEYNLKNYSLCPYKCSYENYNKINKKVSCKCFFQSKSSNLLFDDVISKDKLLNNFMDIKSISNFGIIYCFKESISGNIFNSNIGSYILIIIFLSFILFLILFYIKEYNILKNYIEEIKNVKEQKINFKNNEKINQKKNILITNNVNDNVKKVKMIIKVKKKIKNKRKSITIINNNNISSNNLINSMKEKNYKKYKDSELNQLSFEEAIKIDNRDFLQFYMSLIKTKHILFSSFFKDDYNLNIIKLSLFFYSFAEFYFINALFFTDNTMHKIYEDGGIFNLAYSLPQIFYSTLITSLINYFIRYLALSDKEIVKLKQIENYEIMIKELSNTKKCLRIKYILYFIICFFSLIFFWYYLTCFGSIYKNTQIYLLKDTLISFGISLLYPFIIYLIPTALRINLLKHPKYIYKLSNLLS